MAKKNKKQVEKQEEQKVEEIQVPKVDFSTWYTLREKQIPKVHRKEIIWADFKARKLKDNETMETFDKALEKYGVKLK